jgi:D-alanyl-D-alanine dipeptidase
MATGTRNIRTRLLVWLGSSLRITLYFCSGVGLSANAEEADLIDIGGALPTVIVDARYAGSHNFVGAPVDGYREAKVLLTKPAIEALSAVQARLAEFGLGLKVIVLSGRWIISCAGQVTLRIRGLKMSSIPA